MVLALYVLAGVMMAGGLTAIYSGSDIIVMERGWTMVIAGSVMAAGGALLVGIATAVARLQDLESEFAQLSDRLARPPTPTFAPSPDMSPEPSARARPSAPPPLVIAPEIREHRDLDIRPEPVLSRQPMPEPAAGPLPDETLVSARQPVAEPLPDEVPASTRQPLAEVDIFVPESAPDTPMPPKEELSPPTIVGTYNSGGNFYTMYSDGSIEAETPAGKFRFDSLDELKEFIAAGGDKAKATS